MSEQENGMQEELKMEAKSPGKKRRWSVWVIVLAVLALPVVIPVALVAAGGILSLALAIAGCLVFVVVCVVGCVIAAIVALAAAMVCAVVAVGFGIVMMFSTPASGIAVTGVGLMVLGAGILGSLIVAGCLALFKKALCACGCGIGRLFGRKKERRLVHET